MSQINYGQIRTGYNRHHGMAPYYRFQRKNMLGWDIYGNVQRFGWTPYWGGHDTNKNTSFQAGLNEITSPWGPYCKGNLVGSRVGNYSLCVEPSGPPQVMADLTLWSGRGSAAGYF